MRATRPPWKRHGRRVRSSSVIFRNVGLGIMGAGNTAWRGFSQEGSVWRVLDLVLLILQKGLS